MLQACALDRALMENTSRSNKRAAHMRLGDDIAGTHTTRAIVHKTGALGRVIMMRFIPQETKSALR